MARRFSAPYQSEPVSSLATWARNLAIFSLVAVVVSIMIVRFGFLEMKPALATFFGALACGGPSHLVGVGAFFAVWEERARRWRRSSARCPAPAFPFWSGSAPLSRSGRTARAA